MKVAPPYRGSADRKAEDVAQGQVLGDVDADGDGQVAGQHVTQSQESSAAIRLMVLTGELSWDFP